MKIKFIGATATVTGSKHLITITKGFNILHEVEKDTELHLLNIIKKLVFGKWENLSYLHLV